MLILDGEGASQGPVTGGPVFRLRNLWLLKGGTARQNYQDQATRFIIYTKPPNERMRPSRIQRTAAAVAITVLTTVCLRADAITVQEVDVSPFETPTITVSGLGTFTVYAGINKLMVDGVAMNGFCIDPFHWSLDSSPGYQYVALQNAPKGYAMGANSALVISRLWGSYYSPSMSAGQAAGLQIAIWETVAGSLFKLDSLNDYGASTLLNTVTSLNYSGPIADLVGLSGPGQDYVVGSVPDGGSTATLLGLVFCGLFAVAKRLRMSDR
jgi:hypothetical protein